MINIKKILLISLVAIAALVGCDTEPPSNITENSATLNGRIGCEADVDGTWWWEGRELLGEAQFSRISPAYPFNCPADQDPNTAGYQPNNQVPVSFNWTGLSPLRDYQYRLCVDIGVQGDGKICYGRNGVANEELYDGFKTLATFYVSPTGDNANDGSINAPWRTIRASLLRLQPGSVLYVRGGNYDEAISPITVPSGTATNRIKVAAYPGEQPVLRGFLHILNPNYWTIDNLDVHYLSGLSGGNQLLRISGGTGWTVENSEISGAHSTAGLLIDDGSSDDRPIGQFAVRNNCIHDTVPTNNINQDHNIYVNDFNGSPNANGVIERNILFNATNGRNIKLGPGSPPEGGTHHVVVRFNTAYNAAQNMSASLATHDITFERNLIQVGGEANFWSFELTGQNNVARNNFVGRARAVFDGTSGTVIPITDGGGNINATTGFDSLTCAGFHPDNSQAQSYGRYAP